MWQDLERWGPWLRRVQDANDIWQRRWCRWRWRCRWLLILDWFGLLICYIRMDCIRKDLQNTQLHVNDVDSVSWHHGLSMLVSADTSLSTVEMVKLSMHWKLDVKPHMLVSRTSFAGDCQRGWGERCSYDITSSRMWKESTTLHHVAGRCWLLRGAALGGEWWCRCRGAGNAGVFDDIVARVVVKTYERRSSVSLQEVLLLQWLTSGGDVSTCSRCFLVCWPFHFVLVLRRMWLSTWSYKLLPVIYSHRLACMFWKAMIAARRCVATLVMLSRREKNMSNDFVPLFYNRCEH